MVTYPTNLKLIPNQRKKSQRAHKNREEYESETAQFYSAVREKLDLNARLRQLSAEDAKRRVHS